MQEMHGCYAKLVVVKVGRIAYNYINETQNKGLPNDLQDNQPQDGRNAKKPKP